MQDVQNIIKLLTSTQPDEIREGAFLAGDTHCIESIPYLITQLMSDNVGVLDAVDQALRQIGGVETIQAILPLLASNVASCRNLAMDILRFLAPQAPDAILEFLHDKDPDIRIFIADILGSAKSYMVVPNLCDALLHDPAVNVRYQAAISLGNIGSPSSAKCLQHALGDEEWVQFACIEALAKLKAGSAISALITALDKSSDLVASTIVDALGEIGDIKAVPLLLKRLDNASTPLANKIVKSIISILGEKSLALLGAKECARLKQYMLIALDDEDVDVQDAAILGFSILGGKEASEKILKIGSELHPDRDADRLIKISASLARIGFSPVIENGAYSTNERTQNLALAAVVRMNSPEAIKLMKDLLLSGPQAVQRNIIYALGEKATPADQGFFLQILNTSTDGNVIRGCLDFLGKKGTPEKVQEEVVKFMEHPYADVREDALLAAIALNTPYIHETFLRMSESQDPGQRMLAAYGLGHTNPTQYIPNIKKLMHDEAYEVRREAVKALGFACEHDNQCFIPLQEKMSDQHREVRLAAIEAIGQCQAISHEEAYMAGLDDPDPWVKARCIEQLGKAHWAPAVPKLVDMLQDSNLLLEIKAAEALGKIGGETAFRALMELLDHPDPDVQQAAHEALKQLRMSTGG